jgi:hypothetical protein
LISWSRASSSALATISGLRVVIGERQEEPAAADARA